MKKYLLLSAILLIFQTVNSQNTNFWKGYDKTPNKEELIVQKYQPLNYLIYSLDLAALKNELSKAPIRGTNSKYSQVILSFPNADGKFERFSITEAPVLSPALEAKYPGIKSYAGQGIDDASSIIRFSVSDQRGFSGMVLSGSKGDYFIDPYTTDNTCYMVYYKNDLPDPISYFQCLLDEANLPSPDKSILPKAANDKKLRKYRLALSCTAEYGNIFAGSGTHEQKIANILAQMNITMTRVDGVYENDLCVTMELVPNNDTIMFYGDVNADPWNGEWNYTTQQVIDNRIGDANYDIGHNFNTSGGGNAGCIACVCLSGQKGSGFTGSSNPVGDPFDIDYVAHEMGHQFGGWHTMNTCSRSGSGLTEVEPTSGSTIMGYAGVCTYNIQPHSDAYFAYVSIRDITENVQTGNSSGCAEIINISDEPPTADAGSDYTIPKSTPFALTGIGTDPDADLLTYTWEQNDPEEAPGPGIPQSTWTLGPLSRSYEGTTSPTRFFPKLNFTLAGNLEPTYDVLPSVARVMNFSLTVKDNVAGGGQTADDLMVVTVDGSSGPFKITSPNTNVTWNSSEAHTVTWDVANTNNSPVNCSLVNILLSYDGGYHYPVKLAENTTNDGTENIILPDSTADSCRIKVEAVGNIFFDICDVNFNIINDQGISGIPGYSKRIIYPNPAQNKLFLDLGNEKGVSITFYNSNGSIIKTLDYIGQEIDISDLKQGMYFISIETDLGIINHKFIKTL